MNWIKNLFGVEKPIIGMCHMQAFPGDPGYDPQKGMAWIFEQARLDLLALQEGGVDAILFSNEFSLPYLAMATGAQFVREIFTGVYGSDFGLWNTNAGEIIRHQNAIGANHVRLLFNIVPESAAYLGCRNIADIASSTVFNTRPDALCVSGLTAGSETSAQTLKLVKDAVPDTPVFANTGVRLENVEAQMAVADGAIVGTAFKEGGETWNLIETGRVTAFMQKVRELRKA
jgi:membrane complex biogenesis BtpA family protein